VGIKSRSFVLSGARPKPKDMSGAKKEIATVRFDGEDFRISAQMLVKPPVGTVPFWVFPVLIGLVAYVFGYLFYLIVALFGALFLLASGIYICMVTSKDRAMRFSGYIIPKVMKKVDKKLHLIRKELLKNVEGKVLDVGCATGHYLKYFRDSNKKVTSVIALEPNVLMHEGLKKEIETVKGNFEVLISSQFMEDLKDEGTYDSIVFGNVLCEIPDYEKAIEKAYKLLKPGGRIYFSEHILDEGNFWRVPLQKFMQHWWFTISAGCDCARPTLRALKKMPWQLHVIFSSCINKKRCSNFVPMGM